MNDKLLALENEYSRFLAYKSQMLQDINIMFDGWEQNLIRNIEYEKKLIDMQLEEMNKKEKS